jgi:hypothetical protein
MYMWHLPWGTMMRLCACEYTCVCMCVFVYVYMCVYNIHVYNTGKDIVLLQY